MLPRAVCCCCFCPRTAFCSICVEWPIRRVRFGFEGRLGWRPLWLRKCRQEDSLHVGNVGGRLKVTRQQGAHLHRRGLTWCPGSASSFLDRDSGVENHERESGSGQCRCRSTVVQRLFQWRVELRVFKPRWKVIE